MAKNKITSCGSFTEFLFVFITVLGLNLKTTDSESYETLWQTVSGQKYIIVKVQACASAFVSLSEEPFNMYRDMIEIEFGK